MGLGVRTIRAGRSHIYKNRQENLIQSTNCKAIRHKKQSYSFYKEVE